MTSNGIQASDVDENSLPQEMRTEQTADCSVQREQGVRFHDVLRRTATLLGDDDCSKDWISETRSNFAHCASATLPRQRPALFVTSLDRSRRHNPHPRLASIFKARHGQRDVCAVETLLPEAREAEVTQKSAYNIEFPRRPVAARFRWKSAPAVPQGILPSCRIPHYDDVRDEILLPVEISEKSPSTKDPNKYMMRRRRVSESLNQHRTRERPYSSSACGLYSSPIAVRSQPHFLGSQGRPLANRRHLSAPPTSLTVKGFDGGAAKLQDDTMHSRLLPFLHVPKII